MDSNIASDASSEAKDPISFSISCHKPMFSTPSLDLTSSNIGHIDNFFRNTICSSYCCLTSSITSLRDLSSCKKCSAAKSGLFLSASVQTANLDKPNLFNCLSILKEIMNMYYLDIGKNEEVM